VAGRTAARAIEIGFTGFHVPRLEIGHIDPFPLPALRHRFGLLGVDKSRQLSDLVSGEWKSRHSRIGSSVQDYISDLVPAYIRCHQLRPGEIGSRFSAPCIPAVTEGAVLLEKGPAGGSQLGSLGRRRIAAVGRSGVLRLGGRRLA
jgi:hypothetical protein